MGLFLDPLASVNEARGLHGTAATPSNGIQGSFNSKDYHLVLNDNPAVHLSLRAELQKVGVFVDYDEGLVFFYDVEARVHIYSATGCTFN
ncbi:unnamed protein product [Boreogadus saida]